MRIDNPRTLFGILNLDDKNKNNIEATWQQSHHRLAHTLSLTRTRTLGFSNAPFYLLFLKPKQHFTISKDR